jgi:GntR family transcriptional regulator
MALSIELDPRDPLPLYAQLERGIKRAIAGGELPVGAQLPTVRQLAVNLKVNANTVAKVYAELERQQAVTTRRGVGTFVAAGVPAGEHSADAPSAALEALVRRALAEAAREGYTSQQLVDELRRIAPPT